MPDLAGMVRKIQVCPGKGIEQGPFARLKGFGVKHGKQSQGKRANMWKGPTID